jgi:hypothetical protein
MPQISLSVPHQLAPDEALRRLQEKGEFLRETYAGQVTNFQQHWEGNLLSYAFTTMGFNVHGTVAVEPAEVKVITELPWLAMAFKGKIEKDIRTELEKLLA